MYYDIIKSHYGNQKAERSGISYMNHIDEGLFILDSIGADRLTKSAFCIHPILQLPDSLVEYYNESKVRMWNPKIVMLAMEYRNKANYYSSHNGTKPPTMVLPQVTQMLVADKLQNYKDFLLHSNKYENELELTQYFINWLGHLNCSKYMTMLLRGESFPAIIEELKQDETLRI